MRKNDHHHGADALAQGVQTMYAKGQTDYSIDPLVLVDRNNAPIGQIHDGDAVIFCCRRGEREVELTEAFTEKEFSHFPRPEFKNLTFVILTLYHEKFKDLPIAFSPSKIQDTLSEVVSRSGLRQMHISESEKFSHVTFFFNGGNNLPFAGEDDVCIPSPKGIPFDQIPELSLPQVSNQVLKGIKKQYDLIVVNFANGDVIGHTANIKAKIECAALLDISIGKVVEAARRAGYVTLLTSDHGNLEEMVTQNGSPHVAHTTNLVPLILVDPNWSTTTCMRDGKLSDLAPTILSALSLEQPESMEGRSLLSNYNWGGRRRVLLVILDGWGLGKKDQTNPIYLANTPVWDELIRKYPSCKLEAAGEAVGLKAGKAGNSEAGHFNMGAGRIVPQDDARLDEAIQDGSFFTNEIFMRTIDEVKKRGSKLHLIGLLTEKSSHGSINYPLALLKMAKDRGLDNAYLHIVFDGRSTEPGSAPDLLKKLETKLNEISFGLVVSGMGRGIALDRDGNYARIKIAFDAMVNGIGEPYSIE